MSKAKDSPASKSASPYSEAAELRREKKFAALASGKDSSMPGFPAIPERKPDPGPRKFAG